MEYFKSQKFSNRVNELLEDWHAPGLAVSIIQDGKTEARGYGRASISPDKPVTPDTLFDLASSSKSLTAASVALLVADDVQYPHVEWDSKMSTLLPEDFVMSSDIYTKDITVEDILSHRTGLPSHDLSYLGIKARKPDTPRSVTRNLRNLAISEPIRTKYMYCNLMYTVATYLVERTSGMSFSEFLHKHFFTPLRLNSTNLLPSGTINAGLKNRMAQAYHWSEDKEAFLPVDYQETPEAIGAGSIFTSANDYIKWVKALMDHQSPISANLYKGLTKPRMIQDPEPDLEDEDPFTSPVLYAAGLETFQYRGHKVVVHDGLIAGFASTHFFLPGLKFGGVILGNSSSAGFVISIISRELIDEVIGTPVSERPDWNARQCSAKERSDKKYMETASQEEPQPLDVRLSTYTGKYLNAGYHHMVVEDRYGTLFIDATDRSFRCVLTFEHITDGTKFRATLIDDFAGEEEKLDAEFQFDNGKVTQMGLKLEPDLDDMIWFDKLEQGADDSTILERVGKLFKQ